MLNGLKVGAPVIRILCGIPVMMTVSEVTDTEICCGAWKFSRKSGLEIDEELGWTGDIDCRSDSYITLFV